MIDLVDLQGNALYCSPPLLLDILSAGVCYGINHSVFGDDAHMRPEKDISHGASVRGIGYQKEVTWL